MATDKPKIGFIGLGSLGSCMALQLLKANYPLTVYDRTPEKTQSFTQQGAAIADSPKTLASRCDVIISCVANDTAIEAVMLGENGAISGANANAILIDMSTVAPQTSQRIHQATQQRNLSMIDAAVSGSVPQAKEGSLLILVGGDEAIYQQCKPIFEVLGKASFHMGEVGMGATMKLVVNTLLGVGMQALAEAIVLGEKSGLERSKLLDVLEQMAVVAPAHKGKLENAKQNEYPVNFALRLMVKDFELVRQQAAQYSVSMPTTAAAQQVYAIAQAKNIEEDFSAVIRLMENLASANL